MSGIPLPNPDSDENEKLWGDYTRPGDVHHTKCHNCCGCLIFLALFLGLLALLITGLAIGDPSILVQSWDSTGNFCGRDNTLFKPKNGTNFHLSNFADAPYLFFGAGRPTHLTFPGEEQICVAECPNPDPGTLAEALIDHCADAVRLCPAGSDRAQALANEECLCPYPTTPVANRCLPNLELLKNTDAAENFSALVESVKGVALSVPGLGTALTACFDLFEPILIFSAGAIVVSLIWIFLLRCMASILVYVTVIAVPLALGAVGFWLFYYGENSMGYFEPDNNKYFAYAIWSVTGILIVLIIFLWGKLKAAVQVVKIASRALGKNWTSIFAPFISFVFLLAFWTVTLVSCAYNFSSADLEVVDKNGRPFMQFSVNTNLQYTLIFNAIYLIYITVQIYFANYYAQSSAIVDWYFGDHTGSSCNCRCLYGFVLAWTKALGTITISAVVMTPLYLLIIAMEYLDAKSKASPESIPVLVRFLIKAAKCCLYCFEKFLKYLNKCLITFSQIYNTGWWKSAKLTVDVLLSDVVMTVMMNSVSAFIMFLSKLIVAAIDTIGFFLYLKYKQEATDNWVLPAALVFLFAFAISCFVLGLFQNFIDIVFVCYQSDQDLTNHGTVRKLYISDELGTMLDEYKEAQAYGTKVEAQDAPDGGESKADPGGGFEID
jgi:choline transporter-like protein 2/4/5